MNRSNLIARISVRAGVMTDQVEAVLDAMVSEIVEAMRKGEKVTIAGFGRFEMRVRKEKAYVNPKTKDATQLPPTSAPGFKVSEAMKKRVRNSPRG